MEYYKKPELIIALGSVAGLVIAVGYSYKEFLSIKEDMKLLADHVNVNARKISGLQSCNKAINQIGTVVRDMSNRQIKLAKDILKSRQIEEQYTSYFLELKESLKKKDIDIPDLPNQLTNVPSSIRSRRRPMYNQPSYHNNDYGDYGDYGDYDDDDEYDEYNDYDDTDNLQALDQIRRKRRTNKVR